jgi:hypothetical protein
MATLGNLSQMHSLPPEEQERIMNGPALPPPEGTVPNLDNPPNNNVLGVFALTLIFLFPIVSALLRAYGRIVVVKLVRWEDCEWIDSNRGSFNWGYTDAPSRPRAD